MAEDTHPELNRLYWESDESVAEIARRLDISRRALYDRIEPRPAEVPCRECGGPLVFRNRTAAERLEGECPECGQTAELEASAAGAARPAPVHPGPELEQEDRAAALSPTRRVRDAGSGPVVGLALLVGLGVGALLAYLLLRRA